MVEPKNKGEIIMKVGNVFFKSVKGFFDRYKKSNTVQNSIPFHSSNQEFEHYISSEEKKLKTSSTSTHGSEKVIPFPTPQPTHPEISISSAKPTISTIPPKEETLIHSTNKEKDTVLFTQKDVVPTPTVQKSKQPIDYKKQGELYSKVSKIRIIDVLAFYGYYRGNTAGNHRAITIPCPLPGHIHKSDPKKKKEGTMRIDLAKNIATCWSTNCSHTRKDFRNCMQLLAAIRGDKNQQYVKHLIAKDFGIISEEAFNKFLNGKTIDITDIQQSTQYTPHEDVEFFEELADIETRDRVYRALILTYQASYKNHPANLGFLSADDFDYLTRPISEGGRGMSEKSVKSGLYFTFPSDFQYETFVKILKYKKFIESEKDLDQLLKGVPGFYFNKRLNKWSYANVITPKGAFVPRGIGIPIRNAQKKITGIQIRTNGPQKYTWFSSKYCVGGDYAYGISSGSPLDVVFPENENHLSKTLFITEGRFKAQKIAETYNCIAISVQGVQNYAGIEKEIEVLLKTPSINIQNIVLAYDADMAYNEAVFKQSRNLMNHLKHYFSKEFNHLKYYYAGWDFDYGKGIDDVINSGNQIALSTLDAQTYEQLADQLFIILNKKKETLKVDKLPEEVSVPLFKEYLLSHFRNYEYLKEKRC